MQARDGRNLERLLELLNDQEPNWDEILEKGRERPFFVSFCRPFGVGVAASHEQYVFDLAQMDAVLPDGILFSLCARIFLGKRIPRRSFDGNSLAPMVFRLCRSNGLSLFLVGAKEGVAASAGELLKEQFGLTILGVRSGYFDGPADMNEAAQKVAVLQPDVVLCGMGAPMQDRFLVCMRNTPWHGVAITCGGYFDQIALAADLKFYPEWVNRLHLRAVYRIIREPRRYLPHYTFGYWPFFRGFVQLCLLRTLAKVT